jgi:hypothetical protein
MFRRHVSLLDTQVKSSFLSQVSAARFVVVDSTQDPANGSTAIPESLSLPAAPVPVAG